ncbi:MAG: YraN family protein [Agriterribacter sp.]
MARHNNTGKLGETLASAYLQKNGYTILYTNWRYSHYEIDIIASLHDVLHFVEVKTRRSQKFGNPEESITIRKMEYLIDAADAFLYEHAQWKRVQFDVLSLMLIKGKDPEYFFIEDVYL